LAPKTVRIVNPSETGSKERGVHGFKGSVASENYEISPRESKAVLLFDRLQQFSRFVEVRVVVPGSFRVETLPASIWASPPVTRAVASRVMPSKPNEKWRVISVIRRPEVLAVRKQLGQILLHRVPVHGVKRLVVPFRRNALGNPSVLPRDNIRSLARKRAQGGSDGSEKDENHFSFK